MTVYEHLMLGINLALVPGLQRRHGWQIAAMASLTSALPDWDGLTILVGKEAYAAGHRAWGHSLLVAPVLGGLLGGSEFVLNFCDRTVGAIRKIWPGSMPTAPSQRPSHFSSAALGVWVFLGMTASLSHLAVDVVYSGRGSQETWGIQLFWPFSNQTLAFPMVPWGDLGTTGIFIAEMFALYRWPGRSSSIAWLTLIAIGGYVASRFFFFPA